MIRHAVLVLLAAACGDNNPHHVDGDGGAPAGDAAPRGDGQTPASSTVLAVATDFFSTGVATTVSVPGLEPAVDAVAGVASPDPVVRHQDGRVYVINRYMQDNVTALDDSLGFIAQISTGPGSNPQDVAADGDRVYVATLAGPGVAVIDLSDPDAGVVDTIDLSALDSKDDIPNCHSIVRVERRLVVVCGVLDDDDGFLTPRGPGAVAVIDLDDDLAVTELELDNERPFGFALATPSGSVLIPTVPDFGDLGAGCVELVRAEPGRPPAAAGCLLSNEDLGGYASALAWDPEAERLWLTVTSSFDPDDYGPRGHAVAWDADEAQLGEPATDEEVRPMDVAVCPTGHIVLSDATRGVRVYAPGGAPELTEDPIDIGLPPVTNGLTCF
ncbi:MAG TPA: hypothetical protein VMZ28_28210 [Kofleriaceae bacterium]|nr:hypothetical protein [Kofleriaceae bacterium]